MIDGRLTGLARRTPGAASALALSLVFSLATGLLAVAQAWLVSTVVAAVFLGGQTAAEAARPMAWLLVVIASRALASAGSSASAGRAAIRVKAGVRRSLLAHLLAIGPFSARGQRTGELTATAVQGVESLDAYFRLYLPQLAAAAIIPLTVLIVAFPIDPLSGLVWLVTAPLIPLFTVLIGKAAAGLTRRQFDQLGRLSAHFLDVLQGLTTLRQLSRSREQGRVIEQVGDAYRRATLNVLRVAFLSALVLELVASISTAIVAVAIALRLLAGRLAFQPALFVLILTPEFYLPLRMLGQRFHSSAGGVAAAQRLFDVLAMPTPEPAPSTAAAKTGGDGPVIVFENVDHRYDGDGYSLRGVSFAVQPGTMLALVGRSGAGKSTVAHLLLGFLQPAAGRILAGDLPLEAWPIAEWRRHVAWVPQQPSLFHDTIEANLRLARPDADLQEIAAAARAAHLHEFIDSLPLGYQTVIGEGGERLSGGQAQRLALARAFLRGAPVLLLDEPTSSVDPELEAQLLDSTEQLVRGRTVLVIAHRLATAARADQIVVLDRGVVVESGRHADLMSSPGPYRALLMPALAEAP